jgi:hypothetical protein
MSDARLLAFYLPQYHPVKENDQWWGKGFTEWTNVTKAKPLFKGHFQPRLPADLGFYDLRLPEVREAQAEMAAAYGIHGFCYYHYWFGNGKKILERPFLEVLSSGKPDFPFCLCWANESWEGRWYGVTDNKGGTLIKQEYPEGDYEQHFKHLLPAFKDKRYIKVNGKPLFQVFCPHLIPDPEVFSQVFNEQAIKHGLPGVYLIGGQKTPFNWNPTEYGFDGTMSTSFTYAIQHGKPKQDKIVDSIWESKIAHKLFTKGKSINKLVMYEYETFINLMKEIHAADTTRTYDVFPIVVNDFDNTARAGKKGFLFNNTTPALFKEHLHDALLSIKNKEKQKQLVFLKSWNEWAEGNYLEPDQKYGYQYLQAVKELMSH